MSVITKIPEPNLWEEICKEFASQRPPFEEDTDRASVATDYSDYDPARHNPVFYGKMFTKVEIDEDVSVEFDPAISHPSCLGYSFAEKPVKKETSEPTTLPDYHTCPATDYLNHYIYPWLLPALEAMLKKAKLEKCFERKRTKFNASDFLTEHLYSNNPYKKNEDRQNIQLLDIPFVKAWLKDHPRPPLPKSLIWTDDEAALRIQCFWKGYLVRKEPEIQELRIWQREWREEGTGIKRKVNEFWDKKMPDGDDSLSVPISQDNEIYLFKEIIIPSPEHSETKLDQSDT
ncbi:unnamed protein product [Lymnaea stagnalis]|uniref:IQ domain-containing protein K n=1 Tax=Lymnaea stagnalis TaxID=6523 RepID=A0AAV2HB62_LYMST